MGYGWHTELGLHILRMAVQGVFHRFPGLKIIIRHMGEALPFILAGTDYALKLNDQIDYSLFDLVVDRVHVTTSGLFTLPPFNNLLQTFGADRILLSADYPYCTNEEGRGFLGMLAPNACSDTCCAPRACTVNASILPGKQLSRITKYHFRRDAWVHSNVSTR